MGKYTTIQVKKELYKELNSYCAENGYTKSGLIENLIKQKIRQPKMTNVHQPKLMNVLKVSK
jgi:metal-responsive CopG/Arc/MetJ family transcriptional regulator